MQTIVFIIGYIVFILGSFLIIGLGLFALTNAGFSNPSKLQKFIGILLLITGCYGVWIILNGLTITITL